MQNVLGRIATTLVLLYPVIAFSIPESAIQTSSLKSGDTEQDNADYSRTFDEEQEEKRALRDLQMAGTGKRGWQNLKTTWGKRAQDWQNLHSSWGKRQGWQKLHGGWGKRGWKDMQSGGWGKRAKDMDNGQWSQYNDNADNKYENENPTVLTDKRSWDNFQGSWGKRAADWTSFRGSWGKRSPVDYLNEYSGYGDDEDTYHKAYISPPGYNSYYSSNSPNYPSAGFEN